MIGEKVHVIIERPIGSYHPKHKTIVYEVNYGYIPNTVAEDGEEQDAYVLGVEEPIKEFYGVVIAIIYRKNDNETKWVVAPQNKDFSNEEIIRKTNFQEKYFEIQVLRNKNTPFGALLAVKLLLCVV